jgi:allantoinase
MCSRPAQFSGLGRRKGRIAPGLDADLVVFDDEAQYRIESHMIKYRHKFTPYEGRVVNGTVQRTYVRGNKVFADGDMIGMPLGQPILRSPDA